MNYQFPFSGGQSQTFGGSEKPSMTKQRGSQNIYGQQGIIGLFDLEINICKANLSRKIHRICKCTKMQKSLENFFPLNLKKVLSVAVHKQLFFIPIINHAITLPTNTINQSEKMHMPKFCINMAQFSASSFHVPNNYSQTSSFGCNILS